MEPPLIPSRKTSKAEAISDRYSAIMPPSRVASLKLAKSHAVSTTSMLSQMSAASSTVSEFFESKLQACEADINYLVCYQEGLQETLDSKKMDQEAYHNEMVLLDGKYKPVINELRILKRHRRTIEDDMEEEHQSPEEKRTKSSEEEEPYMGMITRAYASALASKAMASSAKQKKVKFEQSKFRRDVVGYYHARDTPNCAVFCHLTGWHPE